MDVLDQYKITVFTPTYNRGYIIEKAYQSLCRQSKHHFEWVVVDDGSTDNTEELLSKWIQEPHDFPIRYTKVKNGGKHRAINVGVKLAKGELFLILDSDDYLPDNSLEIVEKWEASIADQKDKFLGVVGLRYSFSGKVLGNKVEGTFKDFSPHLEFKMGLRGDRAEVFYTNILKKYPFPEIEGENFISEGMMWKEIGFKEKKKFRYFNENVMFCEYIEDGLSQNRKNIELKNPQGVLLNIKKEILYTPNSYVRRLKLWNKYLLLCDAKKYSHKKMRKDLNITLLDYFLVRLRNRIRFIIKNKKLK